MSTETCSIKGQDRASMAINAPNAVAMIGKLQSSKETRQCSQTVTDLFLEQYQFH